jgi:hypothetical protein
VTDHVRGEWTEFDAKNVAVDSLAIGEDLQEPLAADLRQVSEQGEGTRSSRGSLFGARRRPDQAREDTGNFHTRFKSR